MKLKSKAKAEIQLRKTASLDREKLLADIKTYEEKSELMTKEIAATAQAHTWALQQSEDKLLEMQTKLDESSKLLLVSENANTAILQKLHEAERENEMRAAEDSARLKLLDSKLEENLLAMRDLRHEHEILESSHKNSKEEIKKLNCAIAIEKRNLEMTIAERDLAKSTIQEKDKIFNEVANEQQAREKSRMKLQRDFKVIQEKEKVPTAWPLV
eukprot:TRINITY_DN3523_c0_g1_i1.p1 TRINITY_DN3523_c0_g1~~TRINITY_DN3523_c0_g1_i1.p1  ORF type:complete len:214 (+),score=64.16 TRINITY_DN3523_c0_g1_i1:27-668(+)